MDQRIGLADTPYEKIDKIISTVENVMRHV